MTPMIQQKHIYLMLGLSIGYIIGSTPLLIIIILLGIIVSGYYKLGPVALTHLSTIYKGISKSLLLEEREHSPSKKINVLIRKDIQTEIEEYCQWQDETLESFIIKASSLIFEKDKDWVAYQRAMKKMKKSHPC
jgi:hypothetical protein